MVAFLASSVKVCLSTLFKTKYYFAIIQNVFGVEGSNLWKKFNFAVLSITWCSFLFQFSYLGQFTTLYLHLMGHFFKVWVY